MFVPLTRGRPSSHAARARRSGGAISAVFLLSNFHAHLADCFPYGEGDAKRKMYLLLGSMGVFHVVFLLLFKLYSFSYAL